MTTIWNHRGDDRALWAVIAAIIGSYVLAMRLARWDATWQWVPVALPIAVLLIWFLLAQASVRDLGFPRRAQQAGAADGPVGGAGALVFGAAVGVAGAAALLTAQGGGLDLLGPPAGSVLGGSPAVIAALAVVAAAAQEIVFRGALLRLAIARWSPTAAIAVSGLLAVLGLLPMMLTRSAGTWSWLAASACAVLVLGLALAWAAVRTAALWVPLGWAVGVLGAGAAVLQGWPAEAPGAWAAACVAAVAAVALIPVVLVLERWGRPRAGRESAA